MKIVFIENRYKTFFWSAVGRELLDSGHKISWIVQNHYFTPSGGSIRIVPVPEKNDLSQAPDSEEISFIRNSDRNINHFGGNDLHYKYYQNAIDSILDDVKPDVVIGESTLFHELMAIAWCKRNGVPFLNPSMVGYPSGRFSIYAEATKNPVICNGPTPTDEECFAVCEAIRRRERAPDYMQPPIADDSARVLPLPRSIGDRLMILRGYLAGEHFNTPHPWTKWRLDRSVTRHLQTWERLSKSKSHVTNGKRILLYPMQLQPEANIDVWGQPYRDQANLIKQLADSLPAGWHILIKANPKAKYEINRKLIDILSDHPRITPISLSLSMAEVMPKVDLVCTVTGTIAIESVLSRIPLAQLGPGITQGAPGCMKITAPADIAKTARLVEQGLFRTAEDPDRIALVKKLYATTHAGIISDPAYRPDVINQKNCRRVADAIVEAAKKFTT